MKRNKTILWLIMNSAGVVLVSGGWAQAQVPTLTVDRVSGAVELSHPAAFAIDGYSIVSDSGLLKPDTFAGLAAQNVAGWTVANPSVNQIGELNLIGSYDLGSGAVNLGNAYDAAAGVPLSGEDLTLQFSTPAKEVLEGVVKYVGPINDLVLQVDTVTGAASIQNMSALAGPFDVIGYNIFSASGSLSVEGWNSFMDSGSAGAGWAEANPKADRLTELNPVGSTVFDTGTSIPIGNILAGEQDFVFEYATVDGTLFGSVEYLEGGGGGDCASIAAMRLGGDLDGDGTVGFPDFLAMSANFGQTVSRYEDGDVDCNGSVAFPDFLVLSANFGKSAGATAASVPEPSAGMLALLGVGLFGFGRRRA